MGIFTIVGSWDLMENEFALASVITGDIVGSSILSLERRSDLYLEFRTLSQLLKKQYPREITYDMSNFRGDGWQVVCNRPEKALEITLFVRTYLRFTFSTEKLDTRAAIGIGSIHFIPPENVSAGDGEAFIHSGHLLESLKDQRMGVEYPHPAEDEIYQALDTLILLLDHIVTSWSPWQCQAVFWGLHGYKQSEIAANWKPAAITQASVSEGLQSAGWKSIVHSLKTFESLVIRRVTPSFRGTV